MVLGFLQDAPTLVDVIRDMLPIHPGKFFGKLEQRISVDEALKIMDVDADEVALVVITIMEVVRKICKEWGIDPTRADGRFLTPGSRAFLGKIFALSGAMYIWAHERGGLAVVEVSDPWRCCRLFSVDVM